MKYLRILSVVAALIVHLSALGESSSASYPWRREYHPEESIRERIAAPEGYVRADHPADTFAGWLGMLPLKPGRSTVYLHNGKLKSNQDVHAAVLDIDTGSRDLQQCADAVIRLRAEYLFAAGEFERIHFNFTSGDEASYTRWRAGYRPEVEGNRVSWERDASPDSTYRVFRDYLRAVFMYAGSYSLEKELLPVEEIADIRPGDIFIQGGFPGHAVIVVDMARHRETGEKIFLLAQSYMPAQDIHILRNPSKPDLSPWYGENFGEVLHTPEWDFGRGDLRRFP